jgi:hypothetical protein
METRAYPSCCTSAYCGKSDCSGCPNHPKLKAFEAWRERTQAKQTDPIWCPTFYTATKVA